MNGLKRKILLVIVEDTDTWESKPLYQAIVQLLHKRGIAGATVWNGVMGYGAHHRLHRKGLFGISDEKPVVVTAIDTEAALRSVLADLVPMVKEGLLVLQDAEVFVPSENKKEETNLSI